MTREEIYDDLYKKAEHLMAEYNPCSISDGICQKEKIGDTYSFCCHGCNYLTKKGCRVKSLFSKLWTCAYIEDTLPREFKLEQHKLWNEAFYHRLLIMRGSKKDVMSRKLSVEECRKEVLRAANMYVDTIKWGDCVIISCGTINTFYKRIR